MNSYYCETAWPTCGVQAPHAKLLSFSYKGLPVSGYCQKPSRALDTASEIGSSMWTGQDSFPLGSYQQSSVLWDLYTYSSSSLYLPSDTLGLRSSLVCGKFTCLSEAVLKSWPGCLPWSRYWVIDLKHSLHLGAVLPSYDGLVTVSPSRLPFRMVSTLDFSPAFHQSHFGLLLRICPKNSSIIFTTSITTLT